MPFRPDPPLPAWPALFRGCAFPHIRVLAHSHSTQDDAHRLAQPNSSIVIIAARQTAGRGRLGRAWSDGDGLGLAMTIAVPKTHHSPQTLPLASGIAAIEALRNLPNLPPIGLKWPNDIVQVSNTKAPKRKLGGILIEQRAEHFLIGIGINVHQLQWPTDLAGIAISLRQLGVRTTRPHLAGLILKYLAPALALAPDEVIRQWQDGDCTSGLVATFTNDNRNFRGTVRAVHPLEFIDLQLEDGTVKRLPAATTFRAPEPLQQSLRRFR